MSEEQTADEDIEVLVLSVRTYNCLKRAGITSIARLREMKDSELET